MPSFKDTLELVVHADAAGAISELKNFAGETETQTKKAESSLQRISSGALKLGAAGMGAGAMLTALGDQATAATQQLDAAISAAGQSAEEYRGKIDQAISSDEKFGHTAHETEGALTTLVGSYGDTGKALDRMQLVEDLAAEKHIALADAANIVAKAHGGAGRIFKEFNIQVQTNADGTKNYEGALDELSKKVSGQASASMAGFTGKLKEIGAVVEDDVASFAQKFGPAILSVSTGLTALGGIGQGVTAVLGKLKTARLAATAADAAGSAASVGLATKLGAVGVALGLAAAAYEGYSHSEQVSIDVSKASRASTDQLVNQFKGLESSFFGTKNALDAFTQLAETSTPTAQRLRDALKAQGVDVSALDAILQHETDSQKQANADTDKAAESTKKAAEETKNLRNAVKDLDTAYKTIVDSTISSFEAALALSDAQIATRQSLKDLTDAQATGKATADELSSKQNKVFEAILNEASANEKLAEAQDKANGKTTEAKEAQSRIIEELLKVAATLAPGSELRNRLADYITELQSDIPRKVETSISVDATDALKELARIQAAIDALHGHIDITDVGPGANLEFHGEGPVGSIGTISGGGSGPLAGLPPGLNLGSSTGGNPVRQQSAFAPAPVTVNNYITTTDPVLAGHTAAGAVRAGQFLSVR